MKRKSIPVNGAIAQSEIIKTDDSQTETAAPLIRKSFPIAGIGASAGGLEALEQFFTNMPEKCGIAFIIIQHLDPTHIGMMPELLQRTTRMKVFQATDKLKIKPNRVYVIPPNKSMSILNNSLYLFEPVETRGLRLPIDFFFCSLADDQQENSIGIILSGMGSDGSVGVRAIKEKAGIVLVQEPTSAKFDGMPRSASEAIIADIIAPASELPGKLIDYLNHIPLIKHAPVSGKKDKSELEKIYILLRSQTGHDFTMYKNTTIYRRIERRMGVHKIGKISHYVRYLQNNNKEVEILFKELLIGVTSFFRDPGVWEFFKEKIFPQLFEELPDGYALRAWIPGCSTGEEAYTLAIIFKEALEELKSGKKFSLQIFSTDLDQDAIDKARKGFYRSNITSDISPQRLTRFFRKQENGYTVNSEIREMAVFAPQNMIKDPPFTKLDIVSCRNILIYMEQDLQVKVLRMFHYSLNKGGILLLGNAESIHLQETLFSPLDRKFRFYKHTGLKLSNDITGFPSSFSTGHKYLKEQQPLMKTTENIQVLAEQLLLQQFAPASVLTNENGDIVYITSHTGNYLEPAAGKANMNIFAMARDGLQSELPAAFRKAIQTKEKIFLHNIKMGNNSHCVDVTLKKIENPSALKDLVMVVFTDVPSVAEKNISKSKIEAIPKNAKLDELKAELLSTREELHRTIEEMQTSQEELKSTNEELQSTNEELQSANEELMTSKEEMQSMNEELQTVNIEMQSKIDDYSIMNNDMKNLLNSTNLAILFLDREMRIRRYTNQATNIFKLIQSDIGRVFTDLVTDLDYTGIVTDAEEVLRTLVYIEKEIKTHDRRWFLVRIMPYRTLEDKIDGLVITFTDITKAKKIEEELNNTIAILQAHNLYKNEQSE